MREKPASEAGEAAAFGIPTRRGDPSVGDLQLSGADDAATSWAVGTQLAGGRLSIMRRIGEGGMGVVYEAFDRERDARVALKTLNGLDAGNVYALKHEFRALADVAHHNLVQLHELFAEGDSWFFTMELVEGEPFDQWVRPKPRNLLDEARLRAALPQLFAAMSAIHAAGKLHRDLKPSNVLVTREGRVVVLDFGLVAAEERAARSKPAHDTQPDSPRAISRDAHTTMPERGTSPPDGQGVAGEQDALAIADTRAAADTMAEHAPLRPLPERGASNSVSGTPAYMAPEQAAGQSATIASDYYALGVMLFEALTGDLPFTGRPGEMLAAKQLGSAPRARDVALRRQHAAELEGAPTVSGRRRVSPVPMMPGAIDGDAFPYEAEGDEEDPNQDPDPIQDPSPNPGPGPGPIRDPTPNPYPGPIQDPNPSPSPIPIPGPIPSPSPGSAVGGVPRDLEALCAALLAREPAARPSAAALRALFVTTDPALVVPSGLRSSWPPDIAPELVGRDRELGALREAFAAACAGQPTLLFVTGDSGMGKSALVDAFLSELRADAAAVVLMGRCYERENVPYKGFDALVDELSRCLRSLPEAEVRALLPREVSALARLFPVLDRVPLVAAAEKREISDPQEQQSRAFAALRELFWALGKRGPLVLYIDDLQWLDRDTTALLSHLLGQREATPVLAIASHRSEGAEHNPLLQVIRGLARANRTIEVRELQVGPLAQDAARTLAERCLADHPHADTLAPQVIRDAQGSPYFVAELARCARRRGADELARLSLDDALTDHVAQLPAGARALLELLALAGQPLPVALAIAAAGSADGHRALDALRAEQLVRGSAGHDRVRRIECYHDRVREGVSRMLDDARRSALYTSLARTLEPRSDADPELLARCYEGAGEPERAARAAEQGGDRAVAGLAFERAARLYERALELGSYDEHGRRALRIKHAEALVGAGRGADAARAYCQAADGAEPALALEWKRQAAYQLMTAGQIDQGRVLLVEVLTALGLRLAISPRGLLARALLSRARLRLRGLRLHTPSTGAESAEVMRALDALWTVVQGFAGSDPFAMVDMHARYLARALDAGSALHTARGLGYEAYLASFDGTGTAERAQALGARALELAEAVGNDEVLGFVLGVQACVLVNFGRFAESRRPLARAADLLRTRCRGVAYELTCLEFYEQSAAYHLGELRELGTLASELVEDAVRRGDSWAGTILGTSWAIPAWLLRDDPREVRARFEETERRHKPQSSYAWQDAHLMLGAQRLLRYEGDPARGLARARKEWPALGRSQLLRVQHARAFFLHDRGASALGALSQRAGDAGEARAIAAADARALRRTRAPYAAGWAALLEAGIAQHDGQLERAASLLRAAIGILDANQIGLYAAAARRRLGALLGGDEGAQLITIGDGVFHAQGAKNVAAMTEMLAPGFAKG